VSTALLIYFMNNIVGNSKKRLGALRSRITNRQQSLAALQQEEDTSKERERLQKEIAHCLHKRYITLGIYVTHSFISFIRYKICLNVKEVMKSMVELVIEQDTLVVSCIQLEDKLHRLKTEQMRNNHEYNRLQEDARVAEVYYPPITTDNYVSYF